MPTQSPQRRAEDELMVFMLILIINFVKVTTEFDVKVEELQKGLEAMQPWLKPLGKSIDFSPAQANAILPELEAEKIVKILGDGGTSSIHIPARTGVSALHQKVIVGLKVSVEEYNHLSLIADTVVREITGIQRKKLET